MKLFFDGDMSKTEKTEDGVVMYTYYSSFLHNAIMVDELASKLIDYVIDIGSGNELDCEIIHRVIPELESNEIMEIIEYLIQTGLFFVNSMDYRKNLFAIEIMNKTSLFRVERIYTHLTYNCNLGCDYCYNRDKLNKSKDVLQIADWEKVFDKFEGKKKPIITMTGGEPTLYPAFNEFVSLAYSRGFSLELLTNGTTLNKIPDETIKKITNFIISLDSLDVTKTQRKNSQNYNILQNILELKEKNNAISVRSVMTKDNKSEITELRNYLNKLGIKHVFSYFIPNNLEEIKYVPDFSKEDHLEGADICELSKCSACYRILAIDPYGKVFPCQSLMHSEFVLSDVNHEDWLQEVKKSQITKYFMFRSVESIEECRHCGVRTICGGGCKAISYNLYGDIEHKLDYLCDFMKRDSEFRINTIVYEEV